MTSTADKAAFAGLTNSPATSFACSPNASIVPNGVDLNHFAFRPSQPAAARLFSGKMSYHANVTRRAPSRRDIMPLVWAQRPGAQVWLVGKDPAAEVRKLANDQPPLPDSGEPQPW